MTSPDPDFRPTRTRHVWVVGLGAGEMARMSGLLLGWRQRRGEKRWQAWVISVEPDGSTRQSWVDRRSVEPLKSSETDRPGWVRRRARRAVYAVHK